MSPRSIETFDYTLRPAKNIERKMLCEAFSRLSPLAPLPKYRYVGFGGVAFKDFALIHQRLGVTDMTSIEKETGLRERFRFNKPYSCIRIKWGTSSEVLPKLSWRKRSIVWLDYEGHLDSDILADIEIVAGSVRSGSVLVVTVCAEPERVKADMNVAEVRMHQLRERIGDEKIPRGTRGADLAKWGLASTCREVIDNEITRTLDDRNSPERETWRLTYRQLFNFCYADGTKMLTVGGYFAHSKDGARLPDGHFDDLDFLRGGGEPYFIEVPVLTWREATYLDERLPRLAPAVSHPPWLRGKERRKYGKVYRYFPTYLEAEL